MPDVDTICEICDKRVGITYDVHKALQHPPKWIPPVNPPEEEGKEEMTYNHGSMKHVALMYAKMVKKPFTLDELLEFSKLFKDRDAARHSLNTCTKKNDLAKVGDKWRITPQGVRTVYQMPLARKKVKK